MRILYTEQDPKAVYHLEWEELVEVSQMLAVVSEVEQSSTNWMIGGSIPISSSLRVDVSLGKILNPELLPKAVPSVYECVSEC